ncbi:class I SAM-dependent methyltransferase (plasmid) [Kitasatospora sp. NBC_00070]|uniref:class I SAM-dependent DNA methyltransferase n=1 Tax=Kitasatospora sp. NBC_00070 TaxID=2975962 RepID=UPI002F90CF11
MNDNDGHFGERVAEQYDKSSAAEFRHDTVEQTVSVLAELAGGGRALELGIGTGRIALPLARRGVPVHGIELSRAMVQRMRAKPGGEEIGVSIGDFATVKVDTTADGPFSLAFLVFNTIMNLTSQEAQVACFRNVAEHLAPDGRFVIEVLVPELRKIPAGQNIVPFRTGPTEWAYTVYNTVTQEAACHYVEVTEDGRGATRTIPFRYVWPAELDLMAQLAGLRLCNRWDSWTRTPFTEDSAQHVSVWAKPTG